MAPVPSGHKSARVNLWKGTWGFIDLTIKLDPKHLLLPIALLIIGQTINLVWSLRGAKRAYIMLFHRCKKRRPFAGMTSPGTHLALVYTI